MSLTMFNHYVAQLMLEAGMSERDVRRNLRHANLTLEQANAFGFESIEEYELAVCDFLYS